MKFLGPKSNKGAKMMAFLSSFLVLLPPTSVSAKAIIGVDIGSLYMKVALVQRNSPLEIVTNLHSKRKTEVMVLFDNGSRFYGADASSLLVRKPQLTPASFGVMLGRDADHPAVKVLGERHFPITPSYNETRSGVCLTINGESYTPEELIAMVLTHAKEITAAYGTGSAAIKDCVLTVPSFYTQHERMALLDAAELAGLNVLSLIDETTASALHFGMDRKDEKPVNAIFYNMGGSALQVSVITFYSYEHKETKYGKGKLVGAFEVRGKGWDSTLGGMAFDNVLVDMMADEFNEHWNKKRSDEVEKDIRNFSRPMTKLRVQANKAKQVLSANTDIPIYFDTLYDDTSYKSHVSRAKLEEMSHQLLERTTKPIEQALKAANMTLDDIDIVELIGGGMRVPIVQKEIQNFLGDKLELGLHINSDESMALGSAFHGANVSTAFKVRRVGMIDVNPFPIKVSLSDMLEEEGSKGWFGSGKKQETNDEKEEPWSKEATIFKSFGRMGVKKTIAFTHDSDVNCAMAYAPSDVLPTGTEEEIVRYNVTGVAKFASEMAEKGLNKPKVSLQFELSSSGITKLIKAEAAVEEIVMVTEEIEVDDDEEEEVKYTNVDETSENIEVPAPADAEKYVNTDGTYEKEEVTDEKEEVIDKKNDEPKKKKKKKKTVEKEKKKVHRRSLNVDEYYVSKVQPYSKATMAESKEKLQYLSNKDKERIMLEESRNKVESYIYLIKNKLADNEEEISKISNEEQRSSILSMAMKAEDWLYEDGYDADMATFEDKYAELSEPAEAIFFRLNEMITRPSAISTLNKKLSKVEDLIAKWETEKPQVTEDERASVLEKVLETRKWISDIVEKQENTESTETPAFTSAEVPLQTKDIESLVGKLSRKPKPKPIVEEKEEKNETVTEEKDEEKNETVTEEKDEEEEEENNETVTEEKDEEEEEEEEEETTSETDANSEETELGGNDVDREEL